MLFKIMNNNLIKKLLALTISIYLIISIFIVSYAENYEWTVVDNLEVIETNSEIEGMDNNNETTKEDELNLQSESAILIEQTTRSNII